MTGESDEPAVEDPTVRETAIEFANILSEIVTPALKLTGFLVILIVVMGVAAAVTVLIAPHVFTALDAIPNVVNYIPDIVMTVLKIIVNLVALTLTLLFFWFLWEEAKERATEDQDA